MIGFLRDLRNLVPAAKEVLRRIVASLFRRLARAARNPRGRSSLRVGIDVRPFYEPLTGIGWYLWEILTEISGRPGVEIVLFGDSASFDGSPSLHVTLPPGSRVLNFDFRGLPGSRFAHPLARAFYPVWIWLEGCDLLFGANYFLPRPMSAIATRRVITVHDFTFRRYPELLQHETLVELERRMPREIILADAIICVSEATRRDLVALFEIDPSRARTIHSGLRPAESDGETIDGLPERYVLFVSTIEPRKNLEMLIDAFETIVDEGYPGSLVVVGRVGWKSEGISKRMRTSTHSDRIRHLDYVQREQLTTVYRNAEVFVLPSHYEGFGFPLLEAMSHGIPSIASRTSSLPEVGGDAVIYFEPGDLPGLKAALALLLSDDTLREKMAGRGRTRAMEFSWSRAAEETLHIFREVAER